MDKTEAGLGMCGTRHLMLCTSTHIRDNQGLLATTDMSIMLMSVEGPDIPDVTCACWYNKRTEHGRTRVPVPRPPGIPVLKLKNSPTLSEKFPKFPVVYQA